MSVPRLLALVLVVEGLVTSAPLVGQSAMETATARASEAAQKLHAEKSPARARAEAVDPSTAMPAAPSEVVLSDPTTKQSYLTSMQRYYEYRTNGYGYRNRVFEWQLFSSRVIFGIVLLLVGTGIYFAAVQFHAAMVALRSQAASASPGAGSALASQLEVSTKGIVVNSSVLGVIILALSLAFFYLYLVYVYPIQNVF